MNMIMTRLIETISNLLKKILTFTPYAGKGILFFSYLPNILYFIICLIFIFWEFLGKYFDLPEIPSQMYYYLYSIIRLIIKILVIYISIIAAAKVSTIQNEDFIINIVVGFLTAVKYIYFLILLLILSGFIKGFYLSKCNGKKANEWVFNKIFGSFITIILLMTVILSILLNKFNKYTDLTNSIHAFFIGGVIYFILLLLVDGIENTVGYTTSHWLGISESENPNEDCNGSSGGKSALSNVLYIITAILITIIVILVCILQLIPYPPLLQLNLRVQGGIGENFDRFLEKLSRKNKISPLAPEDYEYLRVGGRKHKQTK